MLCNLKNSQLSEVVISDSGSGDLEATMKAEFGLFLLVWLIRASAGRSYDEMCFDAYSQTFPKDPEIKAERIQVDIVHTISQDDESDQFQSRRKEILNRGKKNIFTYDHPDTVYSSRNLTLFFDGSTVFGAMAAYSEVIKNETVEFSKWLCINSSSPETPFIYFLVSCIKIILK